MTIGMPSMMKSDNTDPLPGLGKKMEKPAAPTKADVQAEAVKRFDAVRSPAYMEGKQDRAKRGAVITVQSPATEACMEAGFTFKGMPLVFNESFTTDTVHPTMEGVQKTHLHALMAYSKEQADTITALRAEVRAVHLEATKKDAAYRSLMAENARLRDTYGLNKAQNARIEMERTADGRRRMTVWFPRPVKVADDDQAMASTVGQPRDSQLRFVTTGEQETRNAWAKAMGANTATDFVAAFERYDELVRDGWTPWAGGECPVGEDTRVAARFRSADVGVELPARNICWKSAVAYKVVG